MNKWPKVATSCPHAQLSRIKEGECPFFSHALSLEKPPEAVLFKKQSAAVTLGFN